METHLHTLCTGIRGDVDLQVVVANQAARTLRETVDGVDVVRLGSVAHVRGAALTPGLRAVLRESTADILHIHVPHPVAILGYLASGFRGRLVVTYHSDILRQRVLGALLLPSLHAALSRASAIIATSPNYIDASPVLRRHRDRCHVLPFSIPLRSFENPDPLRVAEIRQAHGPRIVLAVGRLVGYKGFEFLVEAMRQVNGRLVLIGSGPLREKLTTLATTHGVSDRIAFLDEVDDVASYFHAADVFVLPSVARTEAFGLVQLEAMACGKPIVNTAIDSGVPFVSPHGMTGLTVPPRDPAALAAAITKLLDDEPLRRRLGAAGRSRVHDHFHVDSMVSATLRLYDAVMQTRSGAPAPILSPA